MAGAEIIGKEELLEIQELFEKDKTILYRYGPSNYKTSQFEKEFAEYFGVKYAHAVSSGTAAIHSALSSVGIAKNDEVITTAWTFVAPVEAIVSLGAIPVLANIDETFNIDPIEVEKNITDKTKAIVVVPMWSAPKMDELLQIGEKYNLPIVEDAAQSLGGTYNGKKLGTFGKVGSFSFDFGKTLHVGEGGMIITDDKECYDRAAEFSDHGHMHVDGLPRGKDPRRKPGLNYRISEVSSAIGIAQLRKVDFILEKSKENKKKIKDQLFDIKEIKLRPYTDESGAQGDTLIFSLDTPDQALTLEKILMEDGYGTKILPEAIDWHYAGVWSHIFDEYDQYKDVNIEQKFAPTGDLLKRSICLNIPIAVDDKYINGLIGSLKRGFSIIL
tara:strand:- start:1341 stop:2498 length:1158 start_codon:yes stop_codon:yes gene_type:complete